MLILAPPSEGKSSENFVNVKFNETDFIFKQKVKIILELLKELDQKKIISIYGTTLEKANVLHQKNLNIFKNNCSKAIERYTGVVFKNIDWNSLNIDSKNYLNQHMRILSGLFGILKPDTLIPDYKLKMNVLSLANFWEKDISNYLENEDLILDLLPAIHRKAFHLEKNIVRINFMIRKNGKLSQSAHSGKVVKGKFIRFLAQNNVQDMYGIKKFEYDGYKWNGNIFIKSEL